jgi:stage II sporulation protein GA (sporulation sigma-E factor processing peptidase)
MIVYIEFVIIDNMVIDYILLYILFKCIKKEVKWWRLFISCILGTAVAVLLPLVSLNTMLLFFIKLITGILMVYVCREYKTFKEFVTAAILFFLFTFLLGGIIIGLFFMLKIDYSIENNFNYISNIPIGLILLTAFIMGIVLRITFLKLYKKRNINQFIYNCGLYLNNIKINSKGFMDSGNQLYDYMNDSPVIITGRNTASRLFKEGLFTNGTKARFLEFSTIGGKGKMLIFKIDKLEIYIGNTMNIINNITLGISPYHIKGNEDYDLILHPALIKEIKNV